MSNIANDIFTVKTHASSHNKRRLELLPTRGEIIATELDLMFFDAMHIEDGVRAIRQYLAPVELVKYHEKITQLPQFYDRNLPELLEFYQWKGGAFYSPNAFSKHSTAKNNILTLKSAFMDIDFAVTKEQLADNWEPVNIEEKIQVVSMILEDANLPYPTAFINSGNGLHLYYIFEEPKFDNSKGKVISSLLERINNYLVANFNNSIKNITNIDLIADPIATNSNRLLRLPTTWNGRNEVHCIQFNELYSDMDSFVYEYLPTYDPKKVENAAYARKASKKVKKVKSSNVKAIRNINTLNVSRINDLNKLVKLRDYDIEGQRNQFIHIYASQYYHHANDDWETKVYEMNKKLVSPLPKQEVEIILKSVNRKGYLYKDSKIVDRLDITDEELKYLNISKISAREQRENKRDTKRKAKAERNQRIVEAFKEGLTQTAIAKKENLSRRTIYRLLKNKELI